MKRNCNTSPGSRMKRYWLMIVAVLMLASWYGGHEICKQNRPYSPKAQGLVVAPNDHSNEAFYYFSSGMWLADIRTFIAACRYLLDPEVA